MIFKERSERMLKYEKSKAKLVEFDVKKEDYPKFPINSDDLVYTTLFVLSRYCEELIVNPDSQITSQLFVELTSAAQYYNAAVNSEQWLNHNHMFLLLGATAYFMSEDFGSRPFCSLSSCPSMLEMMLFGIFSRLIIAAAI